MCVDFLLTSLTGKSVIIMTGKENQSHSITIHTAGWVGELGFSEGNKEYKGRDEAKYSP